MESVQQNPYAPPATEAVSSSQPEQAGQQFGAATIAILGWSAFAAWFCFGGRRFGLWADGFGFGGMGLCLLGAPVIGKFLVKAPTRSRRFRCLWLLDIFGLVVFIAGVRMQQSGSSRDVWWLIYAVMGLAMVGLTYVLSIRSPKAESS